jgi:hypothetical protein
MPLPCFSSALLFAACITLFAQEAQAQIVEKPAEQSMKSTGLRRTLGNLQKSSDDSNAYLSVGRMLLQATGGEVANSNERFYSWTNIHSPIVNPSFGSEETSSEAPEQKITLELGLQSRDKVRAIYFMP